MKALFPFYSIGHFINQPTKPTEFEVTRFETMQEPDVDDLHKHTFYEIIWIEEGESRQVIDYKEYDIRANSLFFISPGQLHYFEEWKPVTGGTIMFTADFFLLNHNNPDRLFELSFLDNFYANPCLQPDPNSHADIKHTIDLLTAEHRRADRSLPICQSLLHILLQQVQRSIDSQTGQPVSKKYRIVYKNFKRLVDVHFMENSTASEYAARLNITPHHLNDVTKRVTGKTATDVIRARSILKAKRLLTFTDQTVSEVAAGLNYFDGSYFAKLFRAEVGMAPMAFKVSAQAVVRGHLRILPNKHGFVLTAPPRAVAPLQRTLNEQTISLQAKIPVNRFGAPEDIANTALFLASSESSFLTGSEIRVDGGKSITF